jgi:hypothetical protein
MYTLMLTLSLISIYLLFKAETILFPGYLYKMKIYLRIYKQTKFINCYNLFFK